MKMIYHKNLYYHLFLRKINIEVYGGNMFYIDILKQDKLCVKLTKDTPDTAYICMLTCHVPNFVCICQGAKTILKISF